MRQSRDQILTSHAGSLPRPDALIEANRARESGMETDERRFQDELRSSVAEVVRLQKQAGIAIPGDGEFGKSMGHKVNYRAWWSYSFQRLGGLELGTTGLYDMPAERSRPGEVVLTSFADRRDRVRFAAAYADPDSGITTGPRPALWPVCVSRLTYTGQAAVQSDIANFKAALHAAGVQEGFMTSIAPGSASRIANRYYKTEEEFLFACADAMREEYKAIVDAMLAVKCRAYSFEAANVRHEHEWKVWQDVKLPDGKLILPGIVSHATNVVEHPELVAERITKFANAVGKERVIASTDCGLGGRVHPQIAWAKLEALAQGAALATRQLWR